MQKISITIATLIGLVSTASLHAVSIVTWNSVIDDGFLEGTSVNHSTSVGDNMLGGGIYASSNADIVAGATDPSNLIAGGEIVYSTTADGTLDDTTTALDAITDDQYFQFSFTVDGLAAGESLTIDSFNYNARMNYNSDQRSGWDTSQLAYRVNDSSFTAFDLLGGVNTSAGVSIVDSFSVNTATTVVGLSNGDVVNFRLYAWGADQLGLGTTFHGSTRLGNISIDGTVVPEPVTYATLLGLVGFAIAITVRRR